MDRKKFLGISAIAAGLGGFTFTSGCETTAGIDGTDLEGDLILIRDTAIREAVAVQSYNAAASSGLITDEELADTALLFRDHHTEHLATFNSILRDAGNDIVELQSQAPDDRVSGVQNQEDIIKLAMTLEYEAAEAYFEQAILTLSGEREKAAVGEIFPIEIAHFVQLKNFLNVSPSVDASDFRRLTIDGMM